MLIALYTYAVFGAVFGIFQFCDPIIEPIGDPLHGEYTRFQKIGTAVFVGIAWPVIVYLVLTRGW